MNHFKHIYLSCLLLGLLLSPHSNAQRLAITVSDLQGLEVEGLVVVVEALQNQSYPVSPAANRIAIDQQDKAFVPYISVIQRSGEVSFTNRDDITHHIYSLSRANRFAFKLVAGKSRLITGHLAESSSMAKVSMGCNIHDWMSGYILIVDTPIYGMTDARGLAEFKLIEGGEYRVTVWHPQLQADEHSMQQVVMIEGDTTFKMSLVEPMAPIPKQEGDDDFDFLEQY